MTLDRRRALLRAAAERRFLILQDAYEAEMESAGRPTPTLRAIDTEGLVMMLPHGVV
jgi:GntR family transcriptional regulator/MocR family aminotransferase